jgi:hypothetical protein
MRTLSMKNIIGILLLLSAVYSPIAAANCVTHTYIINGRMITCTTCCIDGGQCTTTCF